MLMVPWNGLVMVHVLRSTGAGGGPDADLLACHHDLETLVGVDEVVMVVRAHVDLDPVDAAPEPTGRGRQVRAHGGAALVADVGRLVGGEDQGLRERDLPRAHRLTVVVERDRAAL